LSNSARPIRHHVLITIALLFLLATASTAQDWIRTGTGLGVEKVRIAASDFKPSTSDSKNAELLKTFNDVLWNDLDNAGIFDLVSKSFYPLQEPGQPSEVNFPAWSSPPPNTSMLAFGNLGAAAGKVTVQGWLYDVKNQSSPQVLGKQYVDNATSDAVRVIAHRFADEIIFRLGGGCSRNRRKQDLLRQRAHRPQRNLGDGLRWRQPAADHALGKHFAVATHLARWLAAGVQFRHQEWLGNHDVLIRSQTAWWVSRGLEV